MFIIVIFFKFSIVSIILLKCRRTHVRGEKKIEQQHNNSYVLRVPAKQSCVPVKYILFRIGIDTHPIYYTRTTTLKKKKIIIMNETKRNGRNPKRTWKEDTDRWSINHSLPVLKKERKKTKSEYNIIWNTYNIGRYQYLQPDELIMVYLCNPLKSVYYRCGTQTWNFIRKLIIKNLKKITKIYHK